MASVPSPVPRALAAFPRSSVLGVLALLAGTPCVAEEPAATEDEDRLDPRVEVDRERGEVRFTCRFANPSRLLEVFACHVTGPSHETVVEFAATGPEIYEALLAIGCRNASHWSGTSPEDFTRTRGDRVLVLVRWEYRGALHEHAAEAMLTDGEAEFPAFVRGFSFSARSPKKVEDIPRGVEVTLGGTNRQRAIFALLVHPTSLPRVIPWMLPPFLDTRVVKDHRTLVEEGIKATIILKRVRSEEELVNFARADAKTRGLADRLPLYDQILPMAREIDALKQRYEGLLGTLRELVSAATEGLPEEEKTARANQAGALLGEGRWLGTRIEERYLAVQALEEAFKARWFEKAGDLPAEAREDALLRSRDGFSYEPLIAAKEVEIAALELAAVRGPGKGPAPAEGGPPVPDLSVADRKALTMALAREIEKLRADRDLNLARSFLRTYEARYQEVDPGDTYMRRLFDEERTRHRIAVKRIAAQGRLAANEARELRAGLDGTWDAIRAPTLRERAAAAKDLQVAELEEKLLGVVEELRWAEGDAESDADLERQRKGRERLEELKKEKVRLEEEVRKAEGEPEPAAKG